MTTHVVSRGFTWKKLYISLVITATEDFVVRDRGVLLGGLLYDSDKFEDAKVKMLIKMLTAAAVFLNIQWVLCFPRSDLWMGQFSGLLNSSGFENTSMAETGRTSLQVPPITRLSRSSGY